MSNSVSNDSLIRNYVPYDFSSNQINEVTRLVTSSRESLPYRVASVAFRTICALVGGVVDTVLLLAQVTYIALVPVSNATPPNLGPLQRNASWVSGASGFGGAGSSGLVRNEQRQASAVGFCSALNSSSAARASGFGGAGSSGLVRNEQGRASAVGFSSALNSSSAAGASSFGGSVQPWSGDIGLDMPEWNCVYNERGEPRYSLRKLLPLRFHRSFEFQISGERLNDPQRQFSLFKGERLLYTGNIVRGDFEFRSDFPAVGFECEALKQMFRVNPLLSDSIPENLLHCSPSSPVNLSPELRADYVIHQDAASYCFVYPLQLHPDKAGLFLQKLNGDATIPAFLKGLILIGGYAYYDRQGSLLQVKSFSASPDATEVLATGMALDISRLNFPRDILSRFETGIAMTSARGQWQGQSNLISPHANRITAPALQHLSHFSYVPQDLYASSPQTTAAAPFGAFLYKNTSGEYQLVPIGGDFIPQGRSNVAQRAFQQALSLAQIQQNNKQLILANIFYSGDSSDVSDMSQFSRCFRSTTIATVGNRVSLSLFNSSSRRCYEISAASGRRITINKLDGSTPITATINPNGEILDCSNVPAFEGLLNEVYLHLMKDMIKLQGRVLYTTKESITHGSIEHLQTFVQAINTNAQNPRIEYLDLNERGFIAIDAGGVLRDYVCQLYSSLMRNSDLFKEISAEESEAHKGLFELRPSIQNSQRALENLGVFLGWVATKGGEYPTGVKLSPKFFQFLHLCLTKNQRLNDGELLDFIKDNPRYPYEPAIIGCIKDSSNQLPTENNAATIQFLLDEDANVTITSSNWSQIKVDLTRYFVDPLERELLSYWFIRQGFLMRFPTVTAYLNRQAANNGRGLNQAVQGRVDRVQIARAIDYNGGNRSVAQKVRWLKQWMQDVNTEIRKVENFLQALSGTSSLGADARIRINELAVPHPNAFPQYHTCFLSVDMPYGAAIDNPQTGGHRDYEQFVVSLEAGLEYALASGGFSFA